jgi:anti-sigma regulatory factor (Ser/Thr protein kinase)
MEERRFPRDLAAVGPLHEFVRAFCRARAVAEDRAYEVDLVAEELFANQVKHQRGPDGVRVGLAGGAGGVTIEIVDRGAERFDPTAVPDDVARRNREGRSGGRGLALVRRLATDFRYDYRDRTSTITAVLRWSP